MIKLANYLKSIERLLEKENDILIKYDKAKKVLKVQYFTPTTIKLLEGSKHDQKI